MSNDLIIPNNTELDVVEDKIARNEKDFDKDFDKVRSDMITILEQGKDGLEYYIDVVKQDNSPRAFEVLAKMIDTLSAANDKLVELHKKRREISIAANPKQINHNNIENAILVGSTKDLQEIINKNKKQIKED